MTFGYCFGCGTRVSTAEVQAGVGRRFTKGLCCQACAFLLERTLSAARESVEKLAMDWEGEDPPAHREQPSIPSEP